MWGSVSPSPAPQAAAAAAADVNSHSNLGSAGNIRRRSFADEGRSILQIFSYSQQRQPFRSTSLSRRFRTSWKNATSIPANAVPASSSHHHENDLVYNVFLDFVDARFDRATYVAFKVTLTTAHP